jgi:cytochrome c-type biogenesis protein CcmH
MADCSPLAGWLIAGFFAALMLASSASNTVAVEPAEVLADPALEARAREIGRDLRCLVCQNQSIDDSDADLARDLRVLVRERLQAGDSDRQVIDYVVSRYGDFVLLRPPLKPSTYVLWFGPALILGLAVVAIVFYYRRVNSKVRSAAAPLSSTDEERLARLLEDQRG